MLSRLILISGVMGCFMPSSTIRGGCGELELRLNALNRNRYEELADRVWKNLNESSILKQILEKSAHADDEDMYEKVMFWGEIGTSGKLYIQIYIEHKTPTQPVTPKLYRSAKTNELEGLTEKIWFGISLDDQLFIAKMIGSEFWQKDQKSWLNNDQSIGIKALWPLLQSGEVKITWDYKYASMIVQPK